ncbi:MAG: nucleoside/nucleotide kinase family protein [Spirochaetaceae bacterium 4572_59]|nr:MAG: nucleoside/nucleotide kinase family protein [Spirochaetaceae bacterium 4572_59]
MEYTFLVNGFENTIDFNVDEVEKVHRSILSRLSALYRAKKRRIICLYAAPPGTGKSTSVALWEILSREDSDLENVQALPIDGFHYSNHYLSSHTIIRDGKTSSLKSIKGAPETYNAEALNICVQQLAAGEIVSWPYYDRNIHEPVLNAIPVTAPIVVIEGNWVLHKDGDWARLRSYADFAVYHDAKENILKKRLIERKIRGGVTRTEAESHYRRSDCRNIKWVRENHLEGDAIIHWNNDLNRWCLDC